MNHKIALFIISAIITGCSTMKNFTEPTWEVGESEHFIDSGGVFELAIAENEKRISSLANQDVCGYNIRNARVYTSNDFEYIVRSEVIWSTERGEVRSRHIFWVFGENVTGGTSWILDD